MKLACIQRLMILIAAGLFILCSVSCRSFWNSFVTKEYIRGKLQDKNFVLLDTRTDEEYLGWQLHGEPRGGHIPGAIHLPSQWFYAKDGALRKAAEVLPLLQERGITADKEIVTYSANDSRAASVCSALRQFGYPRCYVYKNSLMEWANAPESNYPLEKAARYHTVVSPEWVNYLMEMYDGNPYVILETDWAELDCVIEYQQGHLPGALYLSTDLLENGYPRWHLKPLPELQKVIGDFGIARKTIVVVYSRQLIAAARIWWILKYAGVEDVRILNGGYDAWLAHGHRKDTETNRPTPVAFTAPAQEQFLATTEQVRGACEKDSVWIADARSQEEFAGKISGYDYLAMKGRIPGSINIGNGDDSSWLYKDKDGTLRSYTEIGAMWKQQGIHSTKSLDSIDREVIFYCGSGWRSSLTFFYAYLMGYQNIRNYSDGWSGWSTTYHTDPNHKGITPGWRQEPSGNPVVVESSGIPVR